MQKQLRDFQTVDKLIIHCTFSLLFKGCCTKGDWICSYCTWAAPIWGNGCLCGKNCCGSSPHNALIDKINPQFSFKVITSCINIPVILDGFCVFSHTVLARSFKKLYGKSLIKKKIKSLNWVICRTFLLVISLYYRTASQFK